MNETSLQKEPSLQELTQQLQAAQAQIQLLQEQQQRYELALVGAEVGVWELVDLASNQGWCSPQLFRLLGYADGEADFGPADFQARIHPDDRPSSVDVLIAHQADQPALKHEFRVRMKQGHYRWFNSNGHLLWDADKGIYRMFGTLMDIHERKQGQLEFEKLERFQRSLAQLAYDIHLPQDQLLEQGLALAREYYQLPGAALCLVQGGIIDLMYLQDPKADDPSWIFQHRQKKPLAGSIIAKLYDQDEVMSLSELGALDPARVELLGAYGMQTLIGTPFGVKGEVLGTLVCYGYTPRPEDYSPFERDFMRLFAQWVGFMFERHAQLEAMRELNETKDHIITVLSHDLRNSLGAIGSAKLMLDRALNQGQALNPSFLDVIGKANKSAMTLLNELLEASTLEQKHSRLPLEPLPLSPFVWEAAGVFEAQASQKGIRLSYTLPAEPVVAAFNPGELLRALENLFQNALKFTPAGGEIRLEARREGDHACLIVADSGIGIPTHLQAQLFEKFGPARRPGLGGEASHGLGLYISQEIVKRHDGRILVESEPNRGSTFCIELPLVHAIQAKDSQRGSGL